MNMCTAPEENPAVQRFCGWRRNCRWCCPSVFYERLEIPVLTPLAIIDADRGDPGVLPPDPHRMDCPTRRIFTLRPGTRDLKSGIPGTARSAAASAGISGSQVGQVYGAARAELLFIRQPSAAGRFFKNDSQPHWMRCMQGHAAANIMPVIASNRIGSRRPRATRS